MTRPAHDGPPPSRYRLLAWVGLPFLAINLAVRFLLLVLDGDPGNLAPVRLAALLGAGSAYDVAVLAFVLAPFALLAVTLPDSRGGRRLHAAIAVPLGVTAVALFALVAVAEILFWNEFSSRFNFIAVDYLVYTREVLGNIRESYPVGVLLAAIAAAVLTFAAAAGRRMWRAGTGAAGSWRARGVATGAALLLPVALSLAVGDRLRESFAAPSAREIAANGWFEFVRALRTNDLDYRAFYRTLPDDEALAIVRDQLSDAGGSVATVALHAPASATAAHVAAASGTPPYRQVRDARPERDLNVVLVSIESLGADYVEAFGGRRGLTPNLDRLAREGLAFTNLYATGLRTVRGLEALTLSVPPTPGQAVPVRERNKGLPTLGGVFRDHGYDALYLYGGYAVFDGMRDFFSGNGYTVVDRTDIPKGGVSHETIWGVADEDAFAQLIREMDARHLRGRPVFAHLMTTSNHRPFTYPAGRIDIPSGSGRDGAVKYTDYAIGRLIEQARTKPWFDDTVFVFVADHTSHGRGRTDLPPENYHIPLIVWSPRHVAPGVVDTVASQIDVAPTLLGLLHFNYVSGFFGQDILGEGARHPRAFFANYLTVGYMEQGRVVELLPKRRARVVDAASGAPVPLGDGLAERLVDRAVAYYQVASDVLHSATATSSSHVAAHL